MRTASPPPPPPHFDISTWGIPDEWFQQIGEQRAHCKSSQKPSKTTKLLSVETPSLPSKQTKVRTSGINSQMNVYTKDYLKPKVLFLWTPPPPKKKRIVFVFLSFCELLRWLLSDLFDVSPMMSPRWCHPDDQNRYSYTGRLRLNLHPLNLVRWIDSWPFDKSWKPGWNDSTAGLWISSESLSWRRAARESRSRRRRHIFLYGPGWGQIQCRSIISLDFRRFSRTRFTQWIFCIFNRRRPLVDSFHDLDNTRFTKMYFYQKKKSNLRCQLDNRPVTLKVLTKWSLKECQVRCQRIKSNLASIDVMQPWQSYWSSKKKKKKNTMLGPSSGLATYGRGVVTHLQFFFSSNSHTHPSCPLVSVCSVVTT